MRKYIQNNKNCINKNCNSTNLMLIEYNYICLDCNTVQDKFIGICNEEPWQQKNERKIKNSTVIF